MIPQVTFPQRRTLFDLSDDALRAAETRALRAYVRACDLIDECIVLHALNIADRYHARRSRISKLLRHIARVSEWRAESARYEAMRAAAAVR